MEKRRAALADIKKQNAELEEKLKGRVFESYVDSEPNTPVSNLSWYFLYNRTTLLKKTLLQIITLKKIGMMTS